MVSFSSLALLALCIACPLNGELIWQNDYAHARAQAELENKPLLLFFTGSDWSGGAMKMKHEALSSPTFEEKIASQFICVEIDFPKYKTLPTTISSQNSDLQKRFQIEELPAIVVIDSKERCIGEILYPSEQSSQLVQELSLLMNHDREINQGLKQLEHISSSELKKLYFLAQDLNNLSAMEQIVEHGASICDTYFCLEKYRQLVENGQIESQEALELRKQLITHCANCDVEGQSVPFTLALIDFQELCGVAQNFELAAKPLVDYLLHFGSQDQKNVWRAEMMLAEIYLDANKWQEAMLHAEQAYRAAPESMHEEIAESLNYIRTHGSLPQ